MSSQIVSPVPVSSATKRLFLPSSSPLSSMFGSKRTKLSLPGCEFGDPVKGSGLDSPCELPVAEDNDVGALTECIFAGVDHDEGDCTGQCFENPSLESNDCSVEVDDALARFFFGGAQNNGSQLVRSPQAEKDATDEGKEVINISSDPPEADEEVTSVWSMHTATSEGMETDTAVNIAADIKDVFFHRGDDRRIGENSYPTVIYINRLNGKVYQSVVNRELFFLKRNLSGFDERALWLQTNVYIGALMDKCVNESSNPFEIYPILHRHGQNTAITGEELTDGSDAPSDMKHAIRRGWERLIVRYGDMNDIQQEQRALIDKAFHLLINYQRAVVSRDLVHVFKINALLDPLREALNELALNAYVIRELFYRDTKPQFVDAISMI